MIPQKVAGRVPLSVGVRLYWKNLAPMTVFPAVLAATLEIVPERWAFLAFWMATPLFFGCGYYACLPWRRKNISYTYIMFLGCCWLLISPILAILAVLILNAVFNLR